jgi:stage IV sporulation protein A
LEINPSDGSAKLKLTLPQRDYYSVISEYCEKAVESDADLLATIKSLTEIEKEYKKIESALNDVNEKGYGIVMPKPEEMHFEEPSLIKQQNGYGLKIGANAESIHMIRARIHTELSPVVGSKEQTEEVMRFLTDEYEESPKKLWESNMFGKSLYDLMNDGLEGKLAHMPEESREKLGQTLEKIINEGSNGLICILL